MPATRDRGGPEGDKAERAHADRLVREIAVETNEAARRGGGEQAYEHIAEVKVHGSHPSAGWRRPNIGMLF